MGDALAGTSTDLPQSHILCYTLYIPQGVLKRLRESIDSQPFEPDLGNSSVRERERQTKSGASFPEALDFLFYKCVGRW